jgi:hypothetical protein
MTTGSLPSITATQELVVPKSIPMILPILSFSSQSKLHIQNIFGKKTGIRPAAFLST